VGKLVSGSTVAGDRMLILGWGGKVCDSLDLVSKEVSRHVSRTLLGQVDAGHWRSNLCAAAQAQIRMSGIARAVASGPWVASPPPSLTMFQEGDLIGAASGLIVSDPFRPATLPILYIGGHVNVEESKSAVQFLSLSNWYRNNQKNSNQYQESKACLRLP
jgi:hypothetical protein